jgi:hypothetical protein
LSDSVMSPDWTARAMIVSEFGVCHQNSRQITLASTGDGF